MPLGPPSAFSAVTHALHAYSAQSVSNGGSCNSRPAALGRFAEVRRLQLLHGAIHRAHDEQSPPVRGGLQALETLHPFVTMVSLVTRARWSLALIRPGEIPPASTQCSCPANQTRAACAGFGW